MSENPIKKWFQNVKEWFQKITPEKKQKAWTITGIVLCVLLIPILLLNCIMIVQSMVNKDEVPGIGGLSPLIVLSGSMSGEIEEGDIIIVRKIDGEDVGIKDVIAFFDPDSKNNSVLTHRVVDVENREGKLYFQTKGDANDDIDDTWVSEDALIGEWTGFRLPFLGHVAMFMQTTGGLIVCVLIPLVLLVGYDFLRRKQAEKGQNEDVEALKKELEALKAARAEKSEVAENTDAEN